MRTTLVSFDPGGHTGWSVWLYDAITPLRPVAHGTITGGLHGFLEWWDRNESEYRWDEVVMESFRLDGRTPKPDTVPLEIQGAAAALCRNKYPLTLQPNTFKAHMPDAKIKELGLWWPGLGHDRDSLRHAFAYMKTSKHYATLMYAWPPAPIRPVVK